MQRRAPNSPTRRPPLTLNGACSCRFLLQLNKLLSECNFPSICIHSRLKQEERIKRYKSFKDFQKRILVATDLFGP